MGITLQDLEDYSPRLLALRLEAYNENQESRSEHTAWWLSYILNRLRFSRSTPKMTPKKILGRQDSFATRDDMVAKMDRLQKEDEEKKQKLDRWDWI